MSHLERACKEKPPSIPRVMRALILLKVPLICCHQFNTSQSFIEEYESKKEEDEEFNSLQTASYGFPMTLQFYTYRSDVRFSLNVNSSLTLAELREKVAQRIQKPIDAFQLNVDSYLEDADNRTLEELNITNLKPIYFILNDVRCFSNSTHSPLAIS